MRVDDAFLTIAEVAAILKLNQQTVRNWIDQGSLPAVRVGRRIRIRQAELDAFISAGTVLSGESVETEDDAVAGDERLPERLWAELYRQLGKLHAAKARERRAAMLAALRSLSEVAAGLADALDESPSSPTTTELATAEHPDPDEL